MYMNMRASGASEKFCVFTFKNYYFLQYYVGIYFVSETYIFRSQITRIIIVIINAVSFYYLWYGTMYKRQYTDKTLTVKIYVYANERSERA